MLENPPYLTDLFKGVKLLLTQSAVLRVIVIMAKVTGTEKNSQLLILEAMSLAQTTFSKKKLTSK